MTGWRLGWLIGPCWCREDKIRDLICIWEYGAWRSINMADRGFASWGGLYQVTKEMWVQNLDQVMAHMDRLSGLKMVRPDFAFYAFLKLKAAKFLWPYQTVDWWGWSVLIVWAAFAMVFVGLFWMCFAVCPDTLAEFWIVGKKNRFDVDKTFVVSSIETDIPFRGRLSIQW